VSVTLVGAGDTNITVSDHVSEKLNGEEVYSQMFINNISGGVIDASGNLTDLTVSGEIYNVKSGESIYVTFNDKQYLATKSGREFEATIPAADLALASSGEYEIEVSSVMQSSLPITIEDNYTLSIAGSMTANTISLASLVEDYVVCSFTVEAGNSYELAGDASTYFTLSGGDVLLTATGESAYNDTSLALDHVNVTINVSDGTGRVVTKRFSSYIDDPVAFIEATPTKPAHLVGDWELTFQDEFTHPKVRDDHWVLKRGTAGMGYNSMDSVYLEDNKLVLMTQVDPKAHDCEYQHFAGCEITTLDKFSQLYGYFECRAKGNSVRGSWPAFWLMPDRGVRGQVLSDRKMLMSFDLSGVTETINSAVLTYTVESAIKNEWIGEVLTPVENSIYLQTFTFKEWDGSTVGIDDVRVMPFNVLSNEEVNGGDSVDVDVTDEMEVLVDNKYHCMIADNYMTTITVKIHSKDAEDINLRPVLTINGITKIYPYQDGSLRAGDSGTNTSREFNTGDATCEIYDSYANYETTSNGGMEVDIWENLGIWGEDTNAHALHWDGYGSNHKATGSEHIDMGTTEDGYHVYGCLWDEDGLTFYIDGVESWSRSFTPDDDVTDIRAFDVPAYILLSMQTGGWDGNNEQINLDEFPAKAHFDYVRAWQKVEEE
jgi:beta-glucanase (GH16 family)